MKSMSLGAKIWLSNIRAYDAYDKRLKEARKINPYLRKIL